MIRQQSSDYFNRPSVQGKLDAQRLFVRNAWTNYYNLLASYKKREDLPSELIDAYDIMQTTEKMKASRNPDEVKIISITINPPPGVTWDDLEQVCEKIKSKKNFLLDVEYVLEQRSEDPENPYGYHCHIAAKPLKNKKEIINRCYSAYQFYNLPGGKQVIDVNMNSPKAYAYIAGNKDASKVAKTKVDELLRSERVSASAEAHAREKIVRESLPGPRRADNPRRGRLRLTSEEKIFA